MSKSKKKIPLATTVPEFNTPLSGLGALLPKSSLPSKAPVPTAEKLPAQRLWASQEKVVLRREKKGRGGKTVTLVLGLQGLDLEQVAQELRRGLGCGASVDGDTVVLQGAQGERAESFLRRRGARRIVVC